MVHLISSAFLYENAAKAVRDSEIEGLPLTTQFPVGYYRSYEKKLSFLRIGPYDCTLYDNDCWYREDESLGKVPPG